MLSPAASNGAILPRRPSPLHDPEVAFVELILMDYYNGVGRSGTEGWSMHFLGDLGGERRAVRFNRQQPSVVGLLGRQTKRWGAPDLPAFANLLNSERILQTIRRIISTENTEKPCRLGFAFALFSFVLLRRRLVTLSNRRATD